MPIVEEFSTKNKYFNEVKEIHTEDVQACHIEHMIDY